MDIKVFDKNINLLGIIENRNSFRWLEKYNNTGEFGLTVDYTLDNIELLKRGNLIWKDDGDTAGIIQYVVYYTNSIECRGKLTSVLLDDRITSPTIIRNVEDDLRTLITNNCISNRPIPYLALAPKTNITDVIEKKVEREPILKTLIEIPNIGFKMIFNPHLRQHQLKIYQGRDLSTDVIFSEEFENINDLRIYENDKGYKNFAFIYGEEKENQPRVNTTVDLRQQGEELREMYVDARDLQKEDNVTDTQYINQLKQRGIEKLLETRIEKKFEGKIDIDGVYKYKTDFDLGDLVICKSSKNKVKYKVRIMEVEETYNENGHTVVAKTGDLREVYYV